MISVSQKIMLVFKPSKSQKEPTPYRPTPTPPPSESSCGYDSCPKMDPDKINVHLVAHSHDDLGWRKTFDQYFYGVNNTQDPAGIQYLWDTVIYELDKNPERKYVQVETAYLKKWYDEAPQLGFQNDF